MSGFRNRRPSNGWRKIRRTRRNAAADVEAASANASAAHNRELGGPTIAERTRYLGSMSESPVVSDAERHC
jgi:hypothetical protein